jgi:glutathione S-transferase
MKLYTFPPAPNPARVGFYLREKGIEVDTVLLDFTKGEQNSPEHLARNPAGTAPVLELDDGTFLTESLAIIEYLEELYPEPPMIGTDPLSRARTREAERDIEFCVMLRIIRYVHAHRSPLGLPPNPAVAEQELARLPNGLNRVEARLEGNEFVLGSAPSIADCTLLAALNFGRFADLDPGKEYPNIGAWFERYALRHL